MATVMTLGCPVMIEMETPTEAVLETCLPLNHPPPPHEEGSTGLHACQSLPSQTESLLFAVDIQLPIPAEKTNALKTIVQAGSALPYCISLSFIQKHALLESEHDC